MSTFVIRLRMTSQQIGMLWLGPGYPPTMRWSLPAFTSTATKPSLDAADNSSSSWVRNSAAVRDMARAFPMRHNVHNEGRAACGASLSIVWLGCTCENSCRETLLALESNRAIGTALVYCFDKKSR